MNAPNIDILRCRMQKPPLKHFATSLHLYRLKFSPKVSGTVVSSIACHHVLILLMMTGIMSLLSSCVLIPVGWETIRTDVIGARADSSGIVCEQIVHYDKHLNFIAIGLTPEGLLVPSHFGYSRYAAITEHEKYSIWSMEHFPCLAWTSIMRATPIPNSDRWITVEHKDCTMDEIDIKLIIFSINKGKILSRRFKHVRRNPPIDAKTVIAGYIEGNADLSWLRIHETGKITRVNTCTGKIIPETEALPPFFPAEYNWKEQKRLRQQPILRP